MIKQAARTAFQLFGPARIGGEPARDAWAPTEIANADLLDIDFEANFARKPVEVATVPAEPQHR